MKHSNKTYSYTGLESQLNTSNITVYNINRVATCISFYIDPTVNQAMGFQISINKDVNGNESIHQAKGFYRKLT